MKNKYLILAIVVIFVVAIAGLWSKFFSVKKDTEINTNYIVSNKNKAQTKEKIYVAVEDDGVVAVIDSVKGDVIKKIDLSKESHGGVVKFMAHNVQVAPNGKSVWVTANVADDKSMKEINGNKSGEAMNGKMNDMMMGDMMQKNDEVIVIDPQTDSIIKRIEIAPELHLSHVAITPDSSYAIVASQEKGIIYKINASTFKIEKEALTIKGGQPHGLRISPDGKVAYIAMLKGKSLGVLDLDSFKLSYIRLNGSAVQVGVTPDGRYALASVYDTKSLAVYDVASAILKYVELPDDAKGPVQIYPTPDSRYVYVADQGYYFDQPNGKIVYKVDLEKMKAVKEINAGIAPHGVVVSKDGKYVYVTNLLSGDVSVIDTSSDEEVKKIKVGNKPNGISIWSEVSGGTQ